MVRIYAGEKQFRQIYPMKLKRRLSIESLMKQQVILLRGSFPERGQEQIVLDNPKTGTPDVYKIQVEGDKWKEVLCKMVAVKYKNAVIVLTVT